MPENGRPFFGIKFDYVVEAQIQTKQIGHREHLRQDLVNVHLTQVESIRPLRLHHSCLDLVVLAICFVGGEKLVRLEISSYHFYYYHVPFNSLPSDIF